MRRGSFLFLGLVLTGITGQPVLAGTNLVTNGNFATGDFTGWSPSDGSIVIDTAFAPPSDTFDAMFNGGGTLSQPIATTAGHGYTLSFSLVDQGDFILDTFTVTFGGFSTTITGNTAGLSYQPEVFAIPGADITAASTTLSFRGSDPSTLGWNLDDVSVASAAIPEAPTGAVLGLAVLMMLSLRLRGRMIDK
jgi:hypothetical protein